jgi:hypothetical protein
LIIEHLSWFIFAVRRVFAVAAGIAAAVNEK